eukprot:CAMPEP_0195304508 /NCGR_PEP_ID=MMETSP0707-20130614/34584_1 /TAXON_ID=33640 /ORGANISM="Asterionellopsis glacialis, Strain CCMP134" /LENGTH=65 /DNA_ID=CAMNT_0040368337 /DNA_START=160 /DNA_END=357 /DNA_ORIENTATION=-
MTLVEVEGCFLSLSFREVEAVEEEILPGLDLQEEEEAYLLFPNLQMEGEGEDTCSENNKRGNMNR